MAFDPSKYIIDLRGKEYIEVKWRLLWFRTDNPEGCIITRLIEHDRKLFETQETKRVGQKESVVTTEKVAPLTFATFEAAIYRNPNDARPLATGYGSEEKGDFGDYLEKAETKAIGRALGAAGYGTQFSPDHDLEAETTGKVVDAPVAPRTFSFGGS